MARRTGLRTPKMPGDRDPEDFGPYYVDHADVYYQGPNRSTRVQAHQFVPLSDLDEEGEEGENVLGKQFMYWNIRGYIYVRFWKKNTLWRYGPCTLQDYRIFRESSSKGRHVRSLEGFGHGRASSAPGVVI